MGDSRARLTPPAPETPEASDRAWMQRVVLRDDAALEALYARFSGTVYATALAILRDALEAEEVVQDTFVHLWTQARDYNPARGSPGAWMVMLARSRAIDRFRARAWRAQRAPTPEETQALAEPPASPFEQTHQAYLRLRVSAALAALPPEQRHALELAFHEGLSHSEISARTGDPLGTVKTRIRRGLERLAHTFAGSERD